MGRVDFGIGVVGALLLMHSAVSTIECKRRSCFARLLIFGSFHVLV